MRSSMITYFLWWCLLTSFGGVSKGRIYVQQGESAVLFKNVDNLDKEIALYISVNNSYNCIAIWSIKNTTILSYRREDYPNIFMDSNRTIWISNVDETYEGTYIIQNSIYPEVKLSILVLTAVINETTIDATVGHSSFVSCTVTGSYQSINWYVGNNLMSNGLKYQISQSTSGGSTLSSLTIFNVQYTDATLYVCQAVSSIDGVTTASDSVTLSFGGSIHLLESDSLVLDSLESDRIKTIYYVIIVVLSVVLFTVILIIILNRKECYHDWLQDRQIATVKNCLGKLTVEQIGEEIKKWLDDHADFLKTYHGYHGNQILLDDPNFMKKNDDTNRIYCFANLPSLDELGVNWMGLPDDIQEQSVTSHPNSDEHDIYYSTNLPTLDELGIRVAEGLTGREDIKGRRVPSHSSSDEHDIYYSTNLPTLDELGIRVAEGLTGREDIKGRRVPSHSSSDYCATPPTQDDLRVTFCTPREVIHGGRVSSHPSSDEHGNYYSYRTRVEVGLTGREDIKGQRVPLHTSGSECDIKRCRREQTETVEGLHLDQVPLETDSLLDHSCFTR